MKAYLFQSFLDKVTDKKPTIEPTYNQTSWLSNHPDIEVYSGSFVSSSAYPSAHAGFGINKLISEIESGNIEKESFIIFDSFSKITHQHIEQLDDIIKIIWENGLTIITAHDQQEYPPHSRDNLGRRIGLLSIIESAFRVSSLRSKRAKESHQSRRQTVS